MFLHVFNVRTMVGVLALVLLRWSLHATSTCWATAKPIDELFVAACQRFSWRTVTPILYFPKIRWHLYTPVDDNFRIFSPIPSEGLFNL